MSFYLYSSMYAIADTVLSAAGKTVNLHLQISNLQADLFVVSSTWMLLVLATFLLRFNVEFRSPIVQTIERFQHEPVAMEVKITSKSRT